MFSDDVSLSVGSANPPPEQEVAPEGGAVAARGPLPRVYFLGSGTIALPALAALLATRELAVVGCGTQPDRPQGRRQQLQPTPVGAFCAARGLAVHKPENVNDASFLRLLEALQLDLLIVFAFGQILSSALLRVPRCGALNLHASLLPKYRGASPVSAAILAGDRQSGITFIRVVRKLDAGPMYACFPLDLTGRETTAELETRLGELAATQVAAVSREVIAGRLCPQEQDEAGVSYANKLSKAAGWLDWQAPAVVLERQLRAYWPWPGARTVVPGPKGPRQLTLRTAVVERVTGTPAPGTILQATPAEGLLIACGQDALRLLRLVPEGRQEMSGAEFLRGCPLQQGSVLRHDQTTACQL